MNADYVLKFTLILFDDMDMFIDFNSNAEPVNIIIADGEKFIFARYW